MVNKKAEGENSNILIEYVIFFIILLIFVSSIMVFGNKASKQADNIEELYSKQISLIIDNSKSGMKTELDISILFENAIDNNFNGEIVNINNEDNYVLVKVLNGGGKKYYFFSSDNIIWSIDKERAILTIEIL